MCSTPLCKQGAASNDIGCDPPTSHGVENGTYRLWHDEDLFLHSVTSDIKYHGLIDDTLCKRLVSAVLQNFTGRIKNGLRSRRISLQRNVKQKNSMHLNARNSLDQILVQGTGMPPLSRVLARADDASTKHICYKGHPHCSRESFGQNAHWTRACHKIWKMVHRVGSI